MLMKMEAQALSSDEREATSVWKNLASEYATMYEPWPRQEKSCIRPPSNGEFIYNTDAVYDMKTMYDENYIRHPQSMRTQWVPPKNNHRPVQEPMNCKSTYDESYKRKAGQRPPSFKPNPADHHQFSMDGNGCQKVSVNQQTYRAYTKPEFLGAKRKPIIIEQESGIMPSAGRNLTLTTTVQETFRRPSSQSRRQPIIPETTNIPVQSAMELLTTHRADFTPKRAPSMEMPVPALIQDKLSNRLKIPNGQAYDICSTFQNDYITHGVVSRPKSFKPVQQYQPSETPFNHETLYDHDFRAKPMEGIRPMPWKPDGNLKVSAAKGPFQGTTQYRDIHCQKNARYERPVLAKPKTSAHERSMPFFDATSYNTNYRRFGEELVERRQNFKPARKYQPPNIAFTAESTAHAHYRGDPAPPSKICKPVTNKRLDETVIPLHHAVI